MSIMRMPWTVAGQWVSGTAMVAILAAGCGSLPSINSTDGFGTIINSNKSSDLIGGVRLRTNEAVYSFGAWQTDGSVGEITSIVYSGTDGRLSTLYLESGRPSKLVGAHGSRVEISYDEVSTERLKGNIAITVPGSAAQQYVFDVDLQKTAQDIAQLVQQLLNVQISSDNPPDASTSSRAIDGGATIGKSSITGIIVVPIVLVITGYTLNLILSQILGSVLRVATAAVNSFTVALLTPFIFMGNLMRAAAGQPLVTIDYNTDYIGDGPVVLTVPRPTPF